jgi:hypothetical protein
MGEYIEPFDFGKIFLNYFIGNTTLFYFAFLLIFSFTCAKYSMSNRNYFLLLTISSIMFALYIEQGLLTLIFFLVGFVGFRIFSRLA